MLRLICLGACITFLGCSGEHRSTVALSPAATQVAPQESVNTSKLPSSTTLPPPVLVKSDKPIICIYHDYHFGTPLHGIEAVVWSDGRIVWYAGDKAMMGYTDISHLNNLMAKLHQEGVFGNGRGEYEYAAADAPLEAIIVKLADRKLLLRSRHELSGQYPKLDDITQKPTEFERFRRTWKEIRSSVKSWIPAEGVVFIGEILVDNDE
jgi:hypothetical protein